MLFVDARCRYRTEQVGLSANPITHYKRQSRISGKKRAVRSHYPMGQIKDGRATLNFAVDVAQQSGDWAAHE